MVEGVVVSLLQTLASFLFRNYLETTIPAVSEGGEKKEYICEISNPPSKRATETLLRDRIRWLNEKAIQENLGSIIGEREREIVEEFRQDSNLDSFVHWNMEYSRGKGCISKEKLFSYLQKRLKNISRSIALYHEKEAFHELENGYSRENSYFKELEEGF